MPLRLASACVLALCFGACAFPDYDFVAAGQQCVDGRQGASETGIDCGGTCPPCGAGLGCARGNDCASGLCSAGICQVPRCDDGTANGSETDVDCGGDCALCDVDRRCASDFDCVTGVCSGFCQAAQCDDGVLNGSESATDCGGDCDPCADGRACKRGGDCQSDNCIEGRCLNADCMDGVQNGDESDADCGGSCAVCAAGKDCLTSADCESGVCSGQQCADAACDDDVLNGGESDLDCGGTCSGCALGKICASGADCASGACDSDWCVPTSPTGALLPRVGWTAEAAVTFGDSMTSAVFDGQVSRWTSGADQIPGMYFEVDMQNLVYFFRVELDSTSHPDDAAAQFNLYLSRDGTFEAPSVVGRAGEALSTIEFDTAQTARFLRFELTNGKNAWWSISEIRVYQ